MGCLYRGVHPDNIWPYDVCATCKIWHRPFTNQFGIVIKCDIGGSIVGPERRHSCLVYALRRAHADCPLRQTTPASGPLSDIITSVSTVTSVDQDSDASHLGGSASWSVSDIAQVQNYHVYATANRASVSRAVISESSSPVAGSSGDAVSCPA